MKRLRLPPALAVGAAAVVAAGTGCGDKIDVPRSDPTRAGAILFAERCAGCHTLEAAGAQGSKPPRIVSGGERTNGPNLSVRSEKRADVLYAIRNGGFSGAIMPANIVVGKDAEMVAEFVEKWAGKKVGAGGKQVQEGPGRTRNPSG